MMKNILRNLLLILFLFFAFFASAANQAIGDTITIDGKKYKLLSENLISNPGFENGFTGWTDATTAAATLTTAKFSIATTGGINNSKYLIGLTNENSSSSGSIGTGWPVSSGKSYLFAYQVKYLTATTPAASEIYLKISLTNDKTASAEPKVLINSSQVNDAGAWTQNYVFFTNTSPAYSYIQARLRWLGNRLGFDDFMLFEATEVVNTNALQAVITEAQALYNPAFNGAAELQAAIVVAQGYLSSISPTVVAKAITDLQKAIQTYKFANASSSNPLDMTAFIVNQGFSDNTTTGWEGAGTVNYHEVEYYQKTFNLYQVISGLPAGKYRLKAKGFERPKTNDSGIAYKAGTETIYARLYAQTAGYTDVTVPVNSLYKHSFTGSGSSNGYVNTMAAAETMFNNATAGYYDMTLPGILLNEGASLTIGAKSDFQQTGYWTVFDNFRLEYLGVAGVIDLAAAVSNRIAEAQNLTTQHIQNSAIATLNTAITQAQAAVTADPLVSADVNTAKSTIDAAINTAITSLNTFKSLKKAIDDANHILTLLEKVEDITKLQNAIGTANTAYENRDLTLTQITSATATLKAITKSVGKQIYVPTWMMGNVNDPANNWSLERSKQSKNWILFWEPGFGDNPGSIVDECLALAEKSYLFYADSLKFINRTTSKANTYKMIIRLRYTSEWEATGSGVDNTIGLLTLTSWALTSRGGQTIAHEVGHCFQYQVHCDNNDSNGWMYGYGDNASGSNGWWEQCAQWQAYKIFPEQQFTNEWFSGYMSNAHKHLLHEAPRYNNFFIQDYWTDKHGMDMIGRLWNKSIKPEDPVDAYKRITAVTQAKFNDEMWDCAAKFATWDIPAIKTLGASTITSRPQPKLNNTGAYVWRIDSAACPENYGHNIIRLNAPTTAKTVTVYFQGLAGNTGFRKLNVSAAGWRVGFVALLQNGTRVYSEVKPVAMNVEGGYVKLNFDCPAGATRLMLVVSGAPSVHWRHAWDDNDANDEQWPYQVSFNNTNVFGYANVLSAVEDLPELNLEIKTKGRTLEIDNIPSQAIVQIYNLTGNCMVDEKVSGTSFTSELPAGIFLVFVRSEEGTFSTKVLIQ